MARLSAGSVGNQLVVVVSNTRGTSPTYLFDRVTLTLHPQGPLEMQMGYDKNHVLIMVMPLITINEGQRATS